MSKILEQTKYMVLIAIVSLLAASLAAFVWGALKTFAAISLIIVSVGKDSGITVALIELVDSFLIATALFVFSISLYELFIAKLNLPDWMLAHNLHELKAKLSSIIVLVLAVKFLQVLLETKDALAILWTALAVAVVAAALIAFGHFGDKD